MIDKTLFSYITPQNSGYHPKWLFYLTIYAIFVLYKYLSYNPQDNTELCRSTIGEGTAKNPTVRIRELSMDQKIKDLIEVTDKLESRVSSNWNFYTVVVVAIIGWLVSSQISFSYSQVLVVTIVCIAFFIANFYAMRAATKRVIAVESELNTLAKKTEFESPLLKKELSHSSSTLQLISSSVLHVSVDIIVLIAIWTRVKN